MPTLTEKEIVNPDSATKTKTNDWLTVCAQK